MNVDCTVMRLQQGFRRQPVHPAFCRYSLAYCCSPGKARRYGGGGSGALFERYALALRVVLSSDRRQAVRWQASLQRGGAVLITSHFFEMPC